MTSLKAHSSIPPAQNLIVAVTWKCNARCLFPGQAGANSDAGCYTFWRNSPKADLPLGIITSKISPYIKEKHPHVTIVGGEPSLRKDFLGMCSTILMAGPEEVCLFTNGTLFHTCFIHNIDAMLGFLNSEWSKLCIVLSFDEMHRNGLKGKEGLAEILLLSALAKVKSLWGSGKNVKFAIKSVRPDSKFEESAEAVLHKAFSESGLAISEAILDWDTVLRWAKDYLVRLFIPQSDEFFVLTNVKHKNSTQSLPVINIVFENPHAAIPNSRRDSLSAMLTHAWAHGKFGFVPVMVGEPQKIGRTPLPNAVLIDRSVAVRQPNFASVHASAIFIRSDGYVFPSPISAAFQEKSPCNLNNGGDLFEFVKSL